MRTSRHLTGDSKSPGPPTNGKGALHRGRSAQKHELAPPSDPSTDAELAGRQPKRSSSFGRGLGGLQSFTNGMVRASESLSRRATPSSDGTRTPPAGASTAPAAGLMAPPALPDSSHLAQFSLRLSDLVNKSFVPCTAGYISASSGSGTLAGAAKNAAGIATGSAGQGVPSLASVVYDGKKLPNKATVSEIAATVVAELDYAASVDAYLLRAVSRSALKALTLFATRIDSLIVTPSKDSAAQFIPTTAKDGTHPPGAIEYNLGLVSLEWIVEDALERCIEGPPGTSGQGMPHFVSEILTPVRKKMEASILHIIQPLMGSIKSSLTATLQKAVTAPFAGVSSTLSLLPSHVSPVPSGGTPMSPTSPKPSTSPPGASSSWAKELESKLDGARRLLVPRIVDRCGQDGEGWYISIAIHVVWKGLMILSSRSAPPPGPLASKWPVGLAGSSSHLFAQEISKRSPSPAQLSTALKSVSNVTRIRKANDNRGNVSSAATPSPAPTTGATLAASLSNASTKAAATQIADLQTLERLVQKFAQGFVSHNAPASTQHDDDASSSSSDDDDEDELARAALAEALLAIKSTITVVQHLDSNPEALLDAVRGNRGRSHSTTGAQATSTNLPTDAVRAIRAVPPLLLLHLVYARMPTSMGVFATYTQDGVPTRAPVVASPPAIFGFSWAEYERSIGGFAGGQSWATALVQEWRQDVEEAWTDIKLRQASSSKDKTVADQDTCEEAGQDIFSTDPLTGIETLQIPGRAQKPAAAAAPEHDEGAGLGHDEATPTPDSVILQRTASAATSTDASSSERSSESLPRAMTQSAPALDREREQAAKDTSQARPSNKQRVSGGKETRPSWSLLRKPSRSQAPSNDASPQPSPDSSPPRTPNSVAMDLSASQQSGRSTPRTRFWRTMSSSSAAAGGAGATAPGSSLGAVGLGGAETPSRGFHLPQMPGRSRDGSAFAAGGVPGQAGRTGSEVPPSEEERFRDELRLEMESLTLLTKALDAVSNVLGLPSPSSSSSLGPIPSSSPAPVHAFATLPPPAAATATEAEVDVASLARAASAMHT